MVSRAYRCMVCIAGSFLTLFSANVFSDITVCPLCTSTYDDCITSKSYQELQIAYTSWMDEQIIIFEHLNVTKENLMSALLLDMKLKKSDVCVSFMREEFGGACSDDKKLDFWIKSVRPGGQAKARVFMENLMECRVYEVTLKKDQEAEVDGYHTYLIR